MTWFLKILENSRWFTFGIFWAFNNRNTLDASIPVASTPEADSKWNTGMPCNVGPDTHMKWWLPSLIQRLLIAHEDPRWLSIMTVHSDSHTLQTPNTSRIVSSKTVSLSALVGVFPAVISPDLLTLILRRNYLHCLMLPRLVWTQSPVWLTCPSTVFFFNFYFNTSLCLLVGTALKVWVFPAPVSEVSAIGKKRL